MPPPLSDSSSPLAHLNTLYLLACMLVGPEAAPALLQRVIEENADKPPSERPQDETEWVAALLRAHESESVVDTSESPADAERSTDSLRQEAARNAVHDVLPTALAACPPEERFLLALDLLETTGQSPAPSVPASMASSRQPSDAWTTLRTHLMALLSEPASSLVKDALSEDALREATEELMAERYTSVPPPLRARLQTLMETTHSSTESNPESEDEEPEEAASLLDRLPPRPTPRGLLFTLLIGALVLGGGIAVSYMLSSSRAPTASAPSLAAFSVEQSGAVTMAFQTASRTEAEAYVDSVWNRTVTVPTIKGTSLRGVGRVRTERVEIPAFLYGDEKTPITTFAYNYALVQQLENKASLSANVRTALAQSNALVTDPEVADRALLWRHRDDIYVTVSPLPADSLRDRLNPSR